MKRFNSLIHFTVISFGSIFLLSSASAQDNYLLDDDSAEPLYLDFIYPPKQKKPERTNFIKDEILLLYPTEKGNQINTLTKKYNLKTASKSILGSVKTGILVAKTNGQNPLKLSASINKKEKSVEAATNNIYKPAITSFRNAYSMSDTGVRAAHKTTKGAGVTVCMVDTPVDIYHPSLSNAFIETLDLFPFDQSNQESMLHGTSIAGVLVSQNPYIGIAPKAKLYAVGAFKAEKHHPSSLKGASSDIAKAIDACIQHKSDVINLSFTGGKDPLVEKMVKKAIEIGITVVAAAGNGGKWGSTIYPALIPGVLTATAIDENKKLFNMADKGNFIDYAAPGVDILTIAPEGKYKLGTGTSISSAHVSGVVALLVSQNRNKSISSTLTETALDLGKPGRDSEFGDGLVNASRALEVINKQ